MQEPQGDFTPSIGQARSQIRTAAGAGVGCTHDPSNLNGNARDQSPKRRDLSQVFISEGKVKRKINRPMQTKTGKTPAIGSR
jgi:hypothetical protein